MIKKLINNIIDLKYRLRFKLKLLIPMIILIIINFVLLFNIKIDPNKKSDLIADQLEIILVGLIVWVFVSFVRIDFIYKNAYKFYPVILFLLLFTLFFGVVRENAQRWILIGPFDLQTSEVCKILFVFFIGKFLVNRSKNSNDFKTMILVVISTLIVMFLIFKQPDLGTSLVYLFAIFPMMIWSGIKVMDIILFISPLISFFISFIYEFSTTSATILNETYFFIIFSLWILFIGYTLITKYRRVLSDYYIVGIISINLIITTFTKVFIDKLAQTYWFDRIIAYFDPLPYKNDEGFQILSSYQVIGSGGFFGKGIGNGVLTDYGLLPIDLSDFFIAKLAEQVGFIGIFVLVAMLLYFFYWLITYLDKCMNQYEQLILVGFTSIWFFHFFINMSIVSGIVPVTGLPFPFLSLGGSHFITNCIMLAIVNKIISLRISN